MFGYQKTVFIIILFLVPAFLLVLFYIDNDVWNKATSQIRSFSGYLNCDNNDNHISHFPKSTIGPFFNDNPTCGCKNPKDSANRYVSQNEIKDLKKRRAEEYRQHQIRTGKQNDVLVFAPPNTPLQYPIRGFRVSPMKKTLIPGLALQTHNRTVYKVCCAQDSVWEMVVSVSVRKGLLSVMDVQEGDEVNGQNEGNLTISSSSLEQLNDLLSRVTYTSTIYHIKTEDLAYFSFENHEVIFPIKIRRQPIPVLYVPGNDINSQVTVITKTFLRYNQLNVLIQSIRVNYPQIKIIIADDSLVPEKVVGENIEHYIMPPSQGSFPGRNLALSQVMTKYFLWVDDDFVFLNETRLESFVKIMEAAPELDVVGGEIKGEQFAFTLQYEEGDSEEGSCITRVKGTHGPVPGLDGCFFTDGVINYFMARADAVRTVSFDPSLRRVGHSEFFIDGLGKLLVATCKGLSIGHQKRNASIEYSSFRRLSTTDVRNKVTHHYIKNHIKCITY